MANKMKIGILLNPQSEDQQGSSQPLHRSSNAVQAHRSPKQKMPKDAPVFRKVPTSGEVIFRPYEPIHDEELMECLRQFNIFPLGRIAEFCNHIPYESSKKPFLLKTGRKAFEGY
jgi:hypothetical protein